MCTFRLAIVFSNSVLVSPWVLIALPCSLTCCLHDHESTAMILFSRGGTGPIPKSFSLTRRYIDDLITLNNPRFDGAIRKIYPSALTLKETNLPDYRAAYLDCQLEIEKGKLVMSLDDKRDDFPFRVQNYSHLDSNVPACLCTGFMSANFSSFRSRL